MRLHHAQAFSRLISCHLPKTVQDTSAIVREPRVSIQLAQLVVLYMGKAQDRRSFSISLRIDCCCLHFASKIIHTRRRRMHMRKLWVKVWMTLDGVFDAGTMGHWWPPANEAPADFTRRIEYI